MSKEWEVTIYCDGFDGQLTAKIEADSAYEAEQAVYEMWRENSRDAEAVCNLCGYNECQCEEYDDE